MFNLIHASTFFIFSAEKQRSDHEYKNFGEELFFFTWKSTSNFALPVINTCNHHTPECPNT